MSKVQKKTDSNSTGTSFFSKKVARRFASHLLFVLLCDVDLAGYLGLLFDDLREFDGEDTVFDLGGDGVALHIVRQDKRLLVL